MKTRTIMTGSARETRKFENLPTRWQPSITGEVFNHYHPMWDWFQETVERMSLHDESDDLVDQWLEGQGEAAFQSKAIFQARAA